MSTVPGGALVRLLFGFGIGFTSAPVTESIMGSLPRNRAGVGSAVNDTTRQVGGALGVAVVGSIYLGFYHHFVSTTGHLSAPARKALHDSIGTAYALARSLQARHLPQATTQAMQIIDRSRHAFIDSMRLTFPIAAAIMGCAVFVAWRWLPAHASEDA